MTADEKEARDLKRAMMSEDFPEGPDGDIEARKIFVGEILLSDSHIFHRVLKLSVSKVMIPR